MRRLSHQLLLVLGLGACLLGCDREPALIGLVAFVSSAPFAPASPGGGLVAADALCQAVAGRSGRAGRFRAWLSDSREDAIARIDGEGPWRRPDGALLFASRAELAVGPRVAVGLEEHGAPVDPSGMVTGTRQGGLRCASSPTGCNCADWTEAGLEGALGATTDSVDWTGLPLGACALPRPLLCLEVAPPPSFAAK